MNSTFRRKRGSAAFSAQQNQERGHDVTRSAATIKALRILPPLAIGRLGSAEDPLDNYTIEVDDKATLGFRRIVPAKTLVVDPDKGDIKKARKADNITFTADGGIRPVAPFLEVFAV